MVLIPAWSFEMGSANADADDDERPVLTVHLDAFYMDTYEVTNVQFKAFVDANPLWQKDNIAARFHEGDYLDEWLGNAYFCCIGACPMSILYVRTESSVTVLTGEFPRKDMFIMELRRFNSLLFILAMGMITLFGCSRARQVVAPIEMERVVLIYIGEVS